MTKKRQNRLDLLSFFEAAMSINCCLPEHWVMWHFCIMSLSSTNANMVCTVQDLVKHVVFSINLLKTISILQRIVKKLFTQNKLTDASVWGTLLLIKHFVHSKWSMSLLGTLKWAATISLQNSAAQKTSQCSFVDLHNTPDGSDS